MKAIVYSEYGPPEVLKIAEIAKPAPKEKEILVRNLASTVAYGDLSARNFKNLSLRQFNMPALLAIYAKFSFGLRKPKRSVLGSEFSGVIESVGEQVTRFKPGDAVYGYLGQNMGGYAEYICLPEDGTLALKPANLTHAQAAAVPYGAIMAMSLLKKANLQPGQKVLVIGASGGIGSAVVQLARYHGASVTGVCGTQRMEYVQALGAERVIDYTREDFTQNGETYDLIFDVLGRSSFSRCKRSLTEKGIYLLASFKSKALLQMLLTSRTSGRKVICALANEDPQNLALVTDLIESGQYISIIDRSFPLEQAAEAHEYVEAGQKRGNVAISLGGA
jgi:NADPH:quinone reductase-like Zn-dependent oxidoreductase